MKIPKFNTKTERLAYIRANKAEIIKAKKGEVKRAFEAGIDFKIKPLTIKSEANKAEDNENEIERTIIGNTYYWLDSHDDVHVKGTFTKSINDNKDTIPHRHDHINQVAAKVGKFKDVYEKEISWRDLGVDKDGTTISVFGDSVIKKAYNPSIFEQYKDGEINQHSVGMYYMDIQFCSDDINNAEEYKGWSTYINELGNKEKAIEQGYFFAIKEAKLIEISCVTRGSNELTPTQESKEKYEKLEYVLGKENFVLLLKALEENKPLNVTLEEIKPQVSEMKKFYLKQLKK